MRHWRGVTWAFIFAVVFWAALFWYLMHEPYLPYVLGWILGAPLTLGLLAVVWLTTRHQPPPQPPAQGP